MHGGAVSRSGGVSKQLPKILSGQELLPAQGLGVEDILFLSGVKQI